MPRNEPYYLSARTPVPEKKRRASRPPAMTSREADRRDAGATQGHRVTCRMSHGCERMPTRIRLLDATDPVGLFESEATRSPTRIATFTA